MYSVRSNKEKASDRFKCEPMLGLGWEKIDDGVEYYPGMQWTDQTEERRMWKRRDGPSEAALSPQTTETKTFV